jgi:hypothetical protein
VSQIVTEISQEYPLLCPATNSTVMIFAIIVLERPLYLLMFLAVFLLVNIFPSFLS